MIIPKNLELNIHRSNYLQRLIEADKQRKEFLKERLSLITHLRFYSKPSKPKDNFKSLNDVLICIFQHFAVL